jgi:hypothetical protein
MAGYIVKRREYLGQKLRAFGGYTPTYGPWRRVGVYDHEQVARDAAQGPGLYDWGIFFRGKRLPA